MKIVWFQLEDSLPLRRELPDKISRHQKLKTQKHQTQLILTNEKFAKYVNVKNMLAEDVHIRRFPLSFAQNVK